MQMLTALGINSTLFYQLGIFIITFVILNKVVFTPYLRAHKERTTKATGDEDLARQLFVEAQDLEFHYEKKARQVNDQVRALFDNARAEANRKSTEIIEKARQDATSLVEKSRAEVAHKTEQARKDIERELPALTSAVIGKLVGKEINA